MIPEFDLTPYLFGWNQASKQYFKFLKFVMNYLFVGIKVDHFIQNNYQSTADRTKSGRIKIVPCIFIDNN